MKDKAHVVVIEESVDAVNAVSRIPYDLGLAGATIFIDVKRAIIFLQDVVAGGKQCHHSG
jgi:hypothetical protein